jgi:hypothetical protein
MYKFFFTTILCCSAAASVYAQSHPLEGTWTLESAQVNLLENGMSQLVRTLDSQEIQEDVIPAALMFGNKTVLFLQGGEKPLDYSFESGTVSLHIPDGKHTEFTGWIENNHLLVIVSDYKGTAFHANEIRIVYKKVSQ